ncbi:hypothetical protein BLA29_011293 [Euroglyphus maynei]|uniref:Alanine--glyoxylate aminotransferase 2, mitochondrial n=1 Tax=Euroglyphus maynei TaxID=6958 RepID=A0A1Y3AZ89_EURMA|nr:hypothetical protein BLA29_011293 [Euroglyphus maynei]
MAKGIGNGFPMAAVITTPEIAQTLTIGSYFNTFGGNPLASAIGSTVLDVIDEENLQMRSHNLGNRLLKKLAAIRDDYNGEIVGDVRGKGLMIGMEMMVKGKPMPKDHMDQIVEDCKDMGLIVGRGGPQANVFRIAPPMCINEDDVDFTAETIRRSIEKYCDRQAKNKF